MTTTNPQETLEPTSADGRPLFPGVVIMVACDQCSQAMPWPLRCRHDYAEIYSREYTRVRDSAATVEKAHYEKAHEARYQMTHAVHPDILVLWFLALKSHWFDDPDNMFFGQREQAKAYLYKWVETGELADDHTTLEIATAMKFREWLASSWVATSPVAPRDEAAQFTSQILRLAARYDIHDYFFWNTDLQFCVNVNDVFFWGSGDAEEVNATNISDLEQALRDCAQVGDEYASYGCWLFAARNRKMRPQGASYPREQELWPLFDAAGPERETGFGNPYRPGEYKPRVGST